jgi:hypothetical protein
MPTLHAFSDLGRAGVSGQGLLEDLRGFFVGVVLTSQMLNGLSIAVSPRYMRSRIEPILVITDASLAALPAGACCCHVRVKTRRAG